MAYKIQNFADGDLLTADKLNHIEDGIVANEENASKSVKFEYQLLSETQKAQVRANIGALGKDDIPETPSGGETVEGAVKYSEAQSLTNSQKSQARANIGAIGQSDLESATNTALEKAKASGEFDGKDGKDGTNGTDGKDGVDGKTPVKGTDYFTEADKTEMVQSVLETLPSEPSYNAVILSSSTPNSTKKFKIIVDDSGAIKVTEIKTTDPEEDVLEGDGQDFHQFAPTALTFRSTEPLEEFKEVQVNGETVDPENYTLEEGSTIVTLKPEYLKTLGNGNYEISIVSQNKTTSGKFDVTVPDLNEYGFYYNQPYTAYVESLGGKMVFFNREDGTLDIINIAANYIETCTYTIDGKNATMNTSMGTFTGTYSDDGMSIYCNELQVTASLGDESVVADDDYIYIYKEDLNGYSVAPIDKTKAEYGKIKNAIYNKLVVNIAISAFENNVNLVSIPTQEVSVFLSMEIKSIDESAFRGCSNLRKVVLPHSVRTVAYNSFSNCVNIEDLSLSTVRTIDDEAFSGCINLTNVVIPTETEYIGQGAFRNCKSLTEVFIQGKGQYQLSIFAEAFAGCTSLVNIIFNGPIAEWNAIIKDGSWNKDVPATYVQCSDGQVPLV
jgi:hypothetical protein